MAAHTETHLLLDLDLEFAFQYFHQVILAAGVQHPVSDAARVSRHGINEDCEVKEEEEEGQNKRSVGKNTAAAQEEQDAAVCQNPPVDSR